MCDELLVLEPAGKPASKPGNTGIADHDGGQLLFSHLGQPLLAGTLQFQIVVLGVQASVGTGEDEAVIKKLVERTRVRGELSRLQPPVGRLQRIRIHHVPSVTYPVAPMPDRAARPVPTPDTLAPGTVLGTLGAHYRADRAPEYLDLIDDRIHLYRGDGAVAHPGWLLRFANYALSENVRLGPWIHVESAVQNFRDVHDGDDVSARARVVDRFERKGHQLVTLDVLLVVDEEEPAMHVRHTAIYQPRKKEPARA